MTDLDESIDLRFRVFGVAPFSFHLLAPPPALRSLKTQLSRGEETVSRERFSIVVLPFVDSGAFVISGNIHRGGEHQLPKCLHL